MHSNINYIEQSVNAKNAQSRAREVLLASNDTIFTGCAADVLHAYAQSSEQNLVMWSQGVSQRDRDAELAAINEYGYDARWALVEEAVLTSWFKDGTIELRNLVKSIYGAVQTEATSDDHKQCNRTNQQVAYALGMDDVEFPALTKQERKVALMRFSLEMQRLGLVDNPEESMYERKRARLAPSADWLKRRLNVDWPSLLHTAGLKNAEEVAAAQVKHRMQELKRQETLRSELVVRSKINQGSGSKLKVMWPIPRKHFGTLAECEYCVLAPVNSITTSSGSVDAVVFSCVWSQDTIKCPAAGF